jgi:N-methylhydantoinase A
VQTIADAMGLPDAEAAAAGIVDIVNENMLGGLRLVSVQQGFDPRDFALVAFGGAGPLHANALGRLTGAWPVIIPPSPGVLCALGDATTSARDESARTVLRRVGELTGAELGDMLTELADDARKRLAAQGVTDTQVHYEVDVRYHGQGFEIPVPVDGSHLNGSSEALLPAVTAAFDAEHERLFSFTLDTDHEIVNARSTVTGPPPGVATTTLDEGDGDPAAALVRTTGIVADGQRVQARVYDRLRLRAGDVVTGPAIVTEMDSTALVLPGYHATVHPSGSLMIRPTED